MKREKTEKENTVFSRLKRAISNKLYDFDYAVHSKLPKRKGKKAGTMKSARRKDLVFYAALVTIPLLQWVIFYFIVNFNSFFLAFKSYSNVSGFTFVGWQNFGKVWQNLTLKNSDLSNAFINSLIAYGLNFLTLPLSIIVPYYVYKKMPGHEFFRVMLFLPGVLSGMVMSLLIQYILDQLVPFYFLQWFHIKVPPLLSDLSTRFWVVWAQSAFFTLGGNILVYCGVMSRIPEEVVESARLDGCGPTREFISITFPLIFPTASIYFILGFAEIFTNQMSLYTFFAGGSPVQTVGYHIYRTTLASNGFYDYPYVAAMGMFFTFIAAPLTLLIRWLINKFVPTVEY